MADLTDEIQRDLAQLEAQEQQKKVEKQKSNVDRKQKKEKKSKKQSTTFNDLDERFQITEKHDPEHIFDEEREMIARLRRLMPILGK
jgi:hypothetical protein